MQLIIIILKAENGVLGAAQGLCPYNLMILFLIWGKEG